jgi:hypothetical protein
MLRYLTPYKAVGQGGKRIFLEIRMLFKLAGGTILVMYLLTGQKTNTLDDMLLLALDTAVA